MRNDDSSTPGPESTSAMAGSTLAPSGPDRCFSLLERFDRAIDPMLSETHAKAFELVVDGEDSVVEESRPIRVAVYRSLRTLRAEEKSLRRRFVSTLRNRLSALLHRRIDAVDVEAESSLRLSLMSETELDDAVLCASLAIPSEGLFAARLHALAMGLRHAGFPVDAQELTTILGARPVLETYLQALSAYEVEPEIKVAILRTVEGMFLRRMGDAFEELRRLADPSGSAVPAAPSPKVARSGGGSTAGAATHSDGDAGSQEHAQPGGTDYGIKNLEEMGSKVVASVLNLLAGRAKTEGRTGQHAQSWSVEQVIEALSEAQTLVYYRPADCSFAVEHDLSEQLGRFLAERAPQDMRLQLSEAHTAIADLVELVFQFVISTEQEELRALLLKLKIPYLRVALIDRHLFISKTHAARRLLEELASLANRVCRQGSQNEERDTIERAVKEIMTSFDGDVEQLRCVLAAMLGDRERMETRQRAKEERVLRTAEGKERLRLAWKVAHSCVSAATHERHPARIVELILERPWAHYLVMLDLRGQRDTPPWQDALRAMEALVTLTDSVRARGRDAARLTAQQVLQIVRQGLSLVGYNEFDILQLWRCVTRAIVARPDASDEEGNYPQVLAIGLTLQMARVEMALDDLNLPDADMIPSAGSDPGWSSGESAMSNLQGVGGCEPPVDAGPVLAVGDWVDIQGEGGVVSRGKLCWRGVASGLHVFVNRSGVKILEISQRELAQRMREGSVTPRPGSASIDGAIASIFAKLGGTMTNAS